jgi:hypothetical protein
LRAFLLLILAIPVWGAYIVQGPFVIPIPNNTNLPAPTQVSGKEYAAGPNMDQNAVPVPGQSLQWDGVGGVANGILYPPAGPISTQVDAMANHGDALYNALVGNNSFLLFSGYGMLGVPSVLFEAPSGASGIWAPGNQVDSNLQPGMDIVGLEVWGPELGPDGDRYSMDNDWATGCSVWVMGGGCLVQQMQLAAFLQLSADLDLDALMVNEAEGRILFSIRANGPYDGGEIWDFDYVNNVGGFLFHGGHLWDTPFPVAAAFGHLGITNEDISVLEAASTQGDIPEPGTWTLVLIGSGLLAIGRRKRR